MAMQKNRYLLFNSKQFYEGDMSGKELNPNSCLLPLSLVCCVHNPSHDHKAQAPARSAFASGSSKA